MSILHTCQRTNALCSLTVGLALLAAFGDVASVRAQEALPVEAYGSRVPRAWFELSNELTRTSRGFSPPVAARAYGYMGVALYETLVAGMPSYRSLVGQLEGLQSLPVPGGEVFDWNAAANAVLARMAMRMYAASDEHASANQDAIDALEAQLAATLTATNQVTAQSAAYGRAVANAIFRWSLADGASAGFENNFPPDYSGPTGPGAWVPTPPAFSTALQPSWGNTRRFMANSAAVCDPPPPPAYSTDPLSIAYQEALEVYSIVKVADPESVAIANFWSDDPGRTATPPGHAISIATQVLAQQGSSLAVAAETYARLGIALADAFIACWRVKYLYNYLRPVSYVHDQIDVDWTIPLVTPPFPEYPSGHSVMSGAAAEVLSGIFGTVAFTDNTHGRLGLPARSFGSFYEASQEAALSRLYGGIHYRSAVEQGLVQGFCIGELASSLEMQTSSKP